MSRERRAAGVAGDRSSREQVEGVRSQSRGLNGQSSVGHVKDARQRVLRMKWVLWGK